MVYGLDSRLALCNSQF